MDALWLFELEPSLNIADLPLYYSIDSCSINLMYPNTKENIVSLARIMFESLIDAGVKFRFNSKLTIWTCLYETARYEPATTFELRLWNKCNELLLEPRQLTGSNQSFKTKYLYILDRLLSRN